MPEIMATQGLRVKTAKLQAANPGKMVVLAETPALVARGVLVTTGLILQMEYTLTKHTVVREGLVTELGTLVIVHSDLTPREEVGLSITQT